MAREDRSIATIRAELAEVERHLREVPPHHGGGRSTLAERVDRLRRELREAHDRRDQQAQQQQ